MSDIAAAIPDAAPAVTVAEQRVLARIFQHPLSHNLSWRETLALIHAIGSVEHAHNGDVVLKLGGRQQTFKPTHDKDLAAEDVMTLRRFLTGAGWAPGRAGHRHEQGAGRSRSRMRTMGGSGRAARVAG